MPVKNNYVVVYDPCEYPLSVGLSLSEKEMEYGKKLRSFIPGMKLKDKNGKIRTIVANKYGKLRLK